MQIRLQAYHVDDMVYSYTYIHVQHVLHLYIAPAKKMNIIPI